MGTDSGQTRLVFNPSVVPVMNEDTHTLIDGEGWSPVDTSGEWVSKAIEDNRLFVQPESLSTESGVNLNPDVYAVLQRMEEERRISDEDNDDDNNDDGGDDNNDEQSNGDGMSTDVVVTDPPEVVDPAVEEPEKPVKPTPKKASHRKGSKVRDTSSDAENGADKTGKAKE